MFAWLKRLRREYAEYRRFLRVPLPERRIVIYSEGRGYWTHFEPVFRALRDEHDETVLYVTSGTDDPVWLDPPQGLEAFCIGDGSVRTLFFAGLDVRVLLMTLPDLHNYQLRRSPHDVHYVYLHHSMVSSHMIYRAAAFDHFDALLCVGPHHVEETRAREKQVGLPEKILVEHGYGRLDGILAEEASALPLPDTTPTPKSTSTSTSTSGGDRPQVIIAPTWGDNALLERHGADVVRPLLAAGLRVVLRPHPRTRKLNAALLDGIAAQFADDRDFVMDEDTDGKASLLSSGLMISDWSGAALEFALGLERPVLFVDVPRKVLNQDYEKLGITPLEVRVREELGRVVDPDKLESLGELATEMLMPENAGAWTAATRGARQRWIYNSGHSGSAAARYLVARC